MTLAHDSPKLTVRHLQHVHYAARGNAAGCCGGCHVWCAKTRGVLLPLQADLLSVAAAGDAGKVKACLAAGVSINCTDEVGAPLLPMPAYTVGVHALSMRAPISEVGAVALGRSLLTLLDVRLPGAAHG
jgi:hypothetical protein